jgi:Domain of unknown function (DUF4160)
MGVVHREAGLRFIVYYDDHPPAHVHVTGSSGTAKVGLVGANGQPELLTSRGFTGGELRKAMRIIRQNQAVMLEQWSEIHG